MSKHMQIGMGRIRIGRTGWMGMVFLLAQPPAGLAAPFENMDFESAMVPDCQWGEEVSILEGLPAWSGGYGGISQASILHNNATLGDSALAIIGPWGWSSSVLGGSYSALLIGGANGIAWIEQTATVPSDTKSIRMKIRQGDYSEFGFGLEGWADEVEVSMDGVPIPMSVVQTAAVYSIRAGDVTPFAGNESKLVVCAGAWGPYGLNPTYIDDIEFSSQAVVLRIIGLSGNLSFGNVVTGQTATAILTITNSGNAALAVTGIGYPSGFSGAWSGSVAASNSTNVTVTFAPVAVTTYGGTITVTNDSTSGTGQIGIVGAGVFGWPQAQADARFGVISNRFGFNIKWADGQTVMVDACTNLTKTNWMTVVTNTLTNGTFYFNDSEWADYIGRFYRIRSLP